MRRTRKTIKSFCLFNLIAVFAAFNFYLFGQTNEAARPRLKDFGSSLKSKKNKEDANKIDSDRKSDEDTIKINTDLVVNDVLVLDEKGVFVKGLTKEDFVVAENGEKQDVQFIALGDDAKIPRSIVLLIDHSHSQLPFIVNSVMSTKVLIDSLNPDDRLAIVTDNVELLADFTRDKTLLKTKLESLKSRMIQRNFGKSRQYSALLAVCNELFDAEDVRRMVIFQTDGDQLNRIGKKFDFDQLKTAIENSRATVYSIFPGLRYHDLSEKEKYKQAEVELKTIRERFNKNVFDLNTKNLPPDRKAIMDYYQKISEQQIVLAQTAETSGGWTEYLETPAQANRVYSKILESINNRYVVGYYPKNQNKNGKRRIVKIEIKNRPEYRIEGRKTYFAGEPEK